MTTSARLTQYFLRADVVIGPYGSVRNCSTNRNLKICHCVKKVLDIPFMMC